MNFIKGWLLKALKKASVAVVQKQGDEMQAELRAQVACGGGACDICDRLDRVIDGAQRKTLFLVATSGPSWAFLKPVRSKIAEAVLAHGDKLQAKLREEITAHGPKVLDAVFDKAQAVLIANIEALAI